MLLNLIESFTSTSQRYYYQPSHKKNGLQFNLHCGVSAAIVSSLCFTSDKSLVHSIHLCTDVYRGTQCKMETNLSMLGNPENLKEKETEKFLRHCRSAIKGAAGTLHSLQESLRTQAKLTVALDKENEKDPVMIFDLWVQYQSPQIH